MTSQFCSRHATAPSVATCSHCSLPFCAECRVEDVVTELTFCSQQCRESAASPLVGRLITEEKLRQGRKAPISTGWKLWFRTIPKLIVTGLPVGLAVALSSSLLTIDQSGSPLTAGVFVFWALMMYGALVLGTTLTAAYTGAQYGNPYVWAARRYVSWLAVWILVLAATFGGMILLIIPGIIVGVRLFWADEFALAKSFSPFAALKESWSLTKGRVGEIFVFQVLLGLAEYLVLIVGIVVLTGLLLIITTVVPEGSSLQRIVTTTLTATAMLVFYGSFHAPQIVYFYSMRVPSEATSSKRAVAVVAAALGIIFVILIVASIAIPSLLRSRQAANEAAAVANLTMIAAVEITFKDTSGRYGSIDELANAGLIDSSFREERYGYRFSITVENDSYRSVATPLSQNTGRFEFYVGPDVVVRYSEDASLAPPGQAGLPAQP